MLPNLSNTVKRFSQDVNLIRVTTTVINHKPVEEETNIAIKAVIQPADKEKLNIDKIDYSLKYILINSTDEMRIKDKLEYKSTKYRIIAVEDFSDYGYYRAIAEEVKE